MMAATFGNDFTAELSLKNLSCRWEDCKRMYKCKWWDVSIPLMVFRILASGFSMAILTATLLSQLQRSLLPLYAFTIWSYFMLICYFLTASVVSIVHIVKDRQSRTQAIASFQPNNPDFTSDEHITVEGVRSGTLLARALPWYMQLQWGLYNIVLPNALLVTLIYWAVLYPQANYITNFLDISLHALNSVLIIAEQYLAAIPTRLLHVYQPIVYALIYMVFSTILWANTGIVIYPYVLDWTHPGITAGSLCGIILFFFVAQFVIFVISRSTQRCSVSTRY